MLDLETEIRDSLAQMFPALDGLSGDWQAIERAAAPSLTFAPTLLRRPLGRSSRRILLLVSIVIVGVAVPVIAYGTGYRWWFQQPSQVPVPVPTAGKPAVVATGRLHTGDWTFVAFVPSTQHIGIKVGGVVLPHTENLGICTAVIVGKLSNHPELETCGPLRGLPGSLKDAPADGWFTQMNPSTPRLVFGAVASGVARLDLVITDKTGKTTTTTVPLRTVSAIGDGVRFYILHYPIPAGASLVARDANGKTLGQQAATEHTFAIPKTTHAKK